MMDLLDDDDLLDLRGRARGTDPAAVAREVRASHRSLPDANQELQAWAQQPATIDARDAQRNPPATDRLHTEATSKSDQCALCKKRAAKYTCNRCQDRSCAGDFWVMFGLCRGCATEDRVQRFHEPKRAEDRNWLEDTQ